ncbi:dickkopf-related protein 2 [Tachysurus fulvidraco]|uniref:dickkopf-related protein 2 n=1 Tax=Tachysurus fulvidraco TaxID=1234273 RepID=UPI000F4D7632|nr:dickkopf-related protein 2 [Tachysurus fulvidraco]
MLSRSSCCCCCWLLAVLLSHAGVKATNHNKSNNSIKTAPLGEAPTPAAAAAAAAAAPTHPGSAAHVPAKKANVPVQVYSIESQCSSDKDCAVSSYCHSSQHAPSRCVTCRRKKKRCHRDAMCCPGNRCSNFICVPFPENLKTHHIPPVKEHKKLSKDKGWKKSKVSLKGHEGDPCLRSSDCSEGYCCARHFWTKICKPVLRQGEVCTKQRKKGTHNLEIFQRCDCAKGLACKVWKDATSYSKSRLHVCQRT